MGERIAETNGVERKDEVFYVRCRPKIKKALYLQMELDGFSSMTDWFEQFATASLSKCKKTKKRNK